MRTTTTTRISLLTLLVGCAAQDTPPPSDPVTIAKPGADLADPNIPTPPAGQIRIKAGSGALTSFDFGNAQIGSDSATLALTVTNDTADVTGELLVALAGADPAQFRLEAGTDCDDHLILAPGASCNVRLCFSPTALGGASADLTVDATPGGSAALAVTGTGVSAPSLSVSPPFRDFEVIEFGQPASQTFTVTNAGPDLTIASVTATQDLGAGFSVASTTCGGQLANGASCDVTIAFAPTTFGQDSGDLAITTDLGTITQGANFVMGYGAGRVTVTLTGSGGGAVTSDGGGVPNIDCPATSCFGLFVGATHTLTAQPDSSSTFAGWSDASCGTSPTCDVTAGTTPVSITARFDFIP